VVTLRELEALGELLVGELVEPLAEALVEEELVEALVGEPIVEALVGELIVVVELIGELEVALVEVLAELLVVLVDQVEVQLVIILLVLVQELRELDVLELMV